MRCAAAVGGSQLGRYAGFLLGRSLEDLLRKLSAALHSELSSGPLFEAFKKFLFHLFGAFR